MEISFFEVFENNDDWKKCTVEDIDDMVQEGADVNEINIRTHRTVLMWCVLHNKNVKVIEKLIELGADVNAIDDGEETALMKAVLSGSYEVVQLLIAHKADIHKINKNGKTAFTLAIEHRVDSKIIQILKEYGSSTTNLSNHEKRIYCPEQFVLLDIDFENISLDDIEKCIANGSDLNAVTNNGKTVLMNACQSCNNLKIIQRLIDLGININAIDDDGKTALAYSLKNNLAFEIAHILEKSGAKINQLSYKDKIKLFPEKFTLLNTDLKKITPLDVENLICKGADIYAVDEYKTTALMKACQNCCNLNVVQKLIELGIQINAVDATGKTALQYALKSDLNSEIISFLLSKGANTQNLSFDERIKVFPKIYAFFNISFENLTVKKFDDFVKNGASVKITDSDGKNVLMRAIQYHANSTIIQKIVDLGVDVNTVDNQGKTALMLAIENTVDISIIETLLKANIDVNIVDENRKNLLMYAIEYPNEELFYKLVDLGANIKAIDLRGNSVLDITLKKNKNPKLVRYIVNCIGCFEALVFKDKEKYFPEKFALLKTDFKKIDIGNLKKMIDDGADVNIVNSFGITPLILAIQQNAEFLIISKLIEYGANVNAIDNSGITALMYAIKYKLSLCILENLISAGADVNFNCDKNKSILMWALECGASTNVLDCLVKAGSSVNDANILLFALAKKVPAEIIQFLIKLGVNIHKIPFVDRIKYFPNQYALFRITYEFVSAEEIKQIVHQGADLNAVDDMGRTALMLASSKCTNPRVIQKLCELGANVNAKDENGCTALMYAAKNNSNPEIIHKLNSFGADINAINEEGKTVLWYAKTYDPNPEKIQKLKKLGAI